MNAKDCRECHRFSELYWDLSAELAGSKDELTMTHKNSPDYADKKAEVLRLEGLIKNLRSQSDTHKEIHRSAN
jgi:hypothetical protein